MCGNCKNNAVELTDCICSPSDAFHFQHLEYVGSFFRVLLRTGQYDEVNRGVKVAENLKFGNTSD